MLPSMKRNSSRAGSLPHLDSRQSTIDSMHSSGSRDSKHSSHIELPRPSKLIGSIENAISRRRKHRRRSDLRNITNSTDNLSPQVHKKSTDQSDHSSPGSLYSADYSMSTSGHESDENYLVARDRLEGEDDAEEDEGSDAEGSTYGHSKRGRGEKPKLTVQSTKPISRDTSEAAIEAGLPARTFSDSDLPKTKVTPASPISQGSVNDEKPDSAHNHHRHGGGGMLSSFISAASSAAQMLLSKDGSSHGGSDRSGMAEPLSHARSQTDTEITPGIGNTVDASRPVSSEERSPILRPSGTLTLYDLDDIPWQSIPGDKADRSSRHSLQDGSERHFYTPSREASNASRRDSASSSQSDGGFDSSKRIPGFAVASIKRNKEFHAIFKSVPEDDYLIDDYGAALQKEILVHGRFYVSEGHICFNSNIFGWVTNLIISFEDITAVEKKSTAVLFPTAIQISTRHATHLFASFISRDSTYDLIVNIWTLTHPSTQHFQNGVQIADASDGEAVSDVSSSFGNDEATAPDAPDGHEDNDTICSIDGSKSLASPVSHDATGEGSASASASIVRHRASSAPANAEHAKSPSKPRQANTPSSRKSANGTDAATLLEDDTNYPLKHAPTSYSGSSLEKTLINEIVSMPMPKAFHLVFGKNSAWMRHFLADVAGLHEVQIKPWKSESGLSRELTYIRPLSGPVGPKQTSCNVSEKLVHISYDDYIEVLGSTITPDVPSGNSFVVKTKYVFSWAQDNATRFQMSCSVEWSKSSWLKSAVEKGASEGQMSFAKSLMSELQRTAKSSDKKGRSKRDAKNKGGDSTGDKDRRIITTDDTKSDHAATLARTSLFNIAKFIPGFSGSNILLYIAIGLLAMQVMTLNSTVKQLKHGGYEDGGVMGRKAFDKVWHSEEERLWQWVHQRSAFMQGQQLNVGGFEGLSPDEQNPEDKRVKEALAIMQARLKNAQHVLESPEYVKRGRGSFE